jgi:hypothetical protein
MIALPTPELMQEHGFLETDLDLILRTSRVELDADGRHGLRVIGDPSDPYALALRYDTLAEAETDYSRLIVAALEDRKRDRERGFIE